MVTFLKNLGLNSDWIYSSEKKKEAEEERVSPVR
jgi:hypothetical protein